MDTHCQLYEGIAAGATMTAVDSCMHQNVCGKPAPHPAWGRCPVRVGQISSVACSVSVLLVVWSVSALTAAKHKQAMSIHVSNLA